MTDPMPTPKHARDMTAAEYAEAKREIVRAAYQARIAHADTAAIEDATRKHQSKETSR